MNTVTTIATTISMTLDDVLFRLVTQDGIDGIMLLGTTGTDKLTPTSDIDILLVLSDLPVPMRIVNTWIDSRLAEIYCTTVDAIERIVAAGMTWQDGTEEGIVLVWLKEGRIVHDRSGRLAFASERARRKPNPTPAGERQIYDAWRTIGYNVAQIKRYITADDPVSHAAVDMRLLYSVAEVNLHYFTVRQLPWRGEKPAIQYWTDHDPGYLDCFQRFVAEPDRSRRVEMYEQLATLAMAPVGELWKVGETMISVGGGFGAGEAESPEGTVEDAQELWQDLVGETSG